MWEAAIKRQAGRLRAPRHLSAVLAAEFRMLDISAFLLEAAAALPPHHGDPFDRVLVAHALQDDLGVARALDRAGQIVALNRVAADHAIRRS